MSGNIGTHVFGSLNGCDSKLLKVTKDIKKILNEVVAEAKLHKVGESYFQFEPFGVTGVILLSESHISIHTWPEKDFAAVDVFTCGSEGNAELAFDILAKKLKAKAIDKEKAVR